MEIDYEKTMDFEERVDNDVDLYDMREWADDIEEIRQMLKTIDIHTSHLVCYSFWSKYSYNMSAGWLQISPIGVRSVAETLLSKPIKDD